MLNVPQTHLLRFALSVLALASVVVNAACSDEEPTVDRSQPGLIQKSVLLGDSERPDSQQWFMRRTVIEVPYDVGYTFPGETEDAVRIRWEIQRDQLIAFRTNPQVAGTPDSAPVAAFAIEAHVDITRERDPATGEKTNVFSENTQDRPWHARTHIRVDWSKNLLTHFGFHVDQLELDAVAYTPQDPDDEHRPLMGVLGDDGIWQDTQDDEAIRTLDEAHYFDVVTKVSVKPETVVLDDGLGGIRAEPACWYYLNDDCAPGLITVRNSFLRVDAATSDYEPLAYPDVATPRDDDGEVIHVKWDAQGNLQRTSALPSTPPTSQPPDQPNGLPADPYAENAGLARMAFFDKFGFFRTERYGFDPRYGEVESNREYWINRWNIWATSYEDDGRPMEYRKRGLRPIVYHLSPDFPSYLLPEAQRVAEQWSESLQRTAAALGVNQPPLLFEIRENSREVDAETGKVVRRGEVMGDLRYSHIWYVNAPTRAGLLGYGPIATDPNTGEIISASAYIYGTSVKEFAALGRDIVGLLNGTISPESLALGEEVKAYLDKLKEQRAGGPGQASKKAPSREELDEFAQAHSGAAPPQNPAFPGGSPGFKALPPHKHGAKPLSARPGIDRLLRPAGWLRSRLDKAKDTSLETLLMSDPALVGLKTGGRLDPSVLASGLPAGLRERVSPVHWSGPEHRRAVIARFRSYAKRNMMMATFYDEAVAGLAMELADSGVDDVFTTIEKMVFKAAAEHEVGHTLGLRHNFEGSTDALNYHDEYWDLRGSNPAFLGPLTANEVNGRVREYQYSSIMDYSGRFNTDTAGLGKYDYAAIAFGYGQLVEVFDQTPPEPMIAVGEFGAGVFDRPFSLDQVLRDFRHYTSYPRVFGDRTKMRQRSFIPYTRRVETLMNADPDSSMEARLTGAGPWVQEVPYRFCSDEYVFGTSTCHVFDAGADSYEVVQDAIERYDNYYWFKNFKRDRVFFNEWDYMDSLYWRVFGFIQNAYQGWVFDQWFKSDDWEYLRADAAGFDVEDKPWAEARDGGQEQTAAVRDGVAFLMRVIAQPEPGAYMYDFDEGYYWALSNDPTVPLCGNVWAFNTDQYCSDANIALGDGRYFYSQFDVDSGYYFYERLKWIGSFYDKLLALETLTSPDTTFIGVDQGQSVDTWALSMYTSFPAEIETTLAGIASETFGRYAGRFDAEGVYTPPDVFNPAAPSVTPETAPVDPATNFTVQLYALWYGMAFLNANYDNSFNDGAKIWLKGSGEAIEPPLGSEVVEFANPFNARVYVAARPQAAPRDTVGYAMLERANTLMNAYLAASLDPNATPEELERSRSRVTDITENIEVVRGLYEMYGYLYL